MEVIRPQNALVITPFFSIPFSELDFSFVRSSGPGGQNVNKVNSKAVLRWNFLSSPSVQSSLPQATILEVLNRLASSLTEDGDILLSSDRFRDQPRNREDCLTKLTELLKMALHKPKVRKATKATYSSKRRKLDQKSRVGAKKAFRKKPSSHDD